jgi:hypothetical protein
MANVATASDAEKRELNTTHPHSIQEVEPGSLASCDSETYGNRIHCCLVVSPAGRPFNPYVSVRTFRGVA